MKFLCIILIFGFKILSTAQNTLDPNYCYAYDSIRPQQSRWSDRTSNDNIRGSLAGLQLSSCTPARFWLYMRHADRLPSTNDINRMRPFSNEVSNHLLNKDNPQIFVIFSKR